MKLSLVLPTEILLETAIEKLTAEDSYGSFCILPRHIDMTTTLTTCIMTLTSNGRDSYVAVNGGFLVKQGPHVFISARNAIAGDDLNLLTEEVNRQFRQIDDRERKARSALARLEANLTKRIVELQQER